MKKWLVRRAWSQTDMENVLVEARDAQEARRKAVSGCSDCHVQSVHEVHVDKTK